MADASRTTSCLTLCHLQVLVHPISHGALSQGRLPDPWIMRAEDIYQAPSAKFLADEVIEGFELVPADAVNELVVKFERIVGSTYYSVKPEMRAPEVKNTAAPVRFDASVPSLPGKDVNATSHPVSSSVLPAPAALQRVPTPALHQLLYHCAPQVVSGLPWSCLALAVHRLLANS